jgi:hypothetical protein
MTETRTRTPRFNHVAMSVPADQLTDEARADIVAFYGEVFGWVHHTEHGEPGNPLILGMTDPMQFVYIHPEESGAGLSAPRMDHYGVQVGTEEELDLVLERARRYQEKDDRVEIIEKDVTQYGGAEADAAGVKVELVNCYFRYVLPLAVEVQHFRFKPIGAR